MNDKFKTTASIHFFFSIRTGRQINETPYIWPFNLVSSDSVLLNCVCVKCFHITVHIKLLTVNHLAAVEANSLCQEIISIKCINLTNSVIMFLEGNIY